MHLIEDGARFAPGDESTDILYAAAPARFGPVSQRWRKEILTFADWAARRRPFEAVQILLPDRAGSFPTSRAYAGPPAAALRLAQRGTGFPAVATAGPPALLASTTQERRWPRSRLRTL